MRVVYKYNQEEIKIEDVKEHYSHRVVLVQTFKRVRRCYLPLKVDNYWSAQVLGFKGLLDIDNVIVRYDSLQMLLNSLLRNSQTEAFVFKTNKELFDFIGGIATNE